MRRIQITTLQKLADTEKLLSSNHGLTDIMNIFRKKLFLNKP